MTKNRAQMMDRQKVLAEFGEFALQCENLDEILHLACVQVAQVMGTTRAKVLEIVPDEQVLFVRAGIGWAEHVVGRLRLPMDEHSSETFSIQARAPVISRDIRDETRFEVPEFMKHAGVIALVNVPILLPRHEPYGLIQVDATEPREFCDEDSEFLRTYAMILGPVIDRLRKLNDLATTRERFELMVGNALNYAVIMTDAEDRIVDWTPGAQAVFGWSRDEIVGQPAAVLFTAEDRAHHVDRAEVEEAARTGEAPNVRWHAHKSGRHVFIDGTVKALRDEAGALTGFIKIGQDVTDERLWQERQRVLIEGVPQLVWRAEGIGQWTWSSPQWNAYTGQDASQSAQLGWLEMIHPDDRPATMDAWRAAAARGLLEVEHRIRQHGEDRYRWFQTRARPVRDGDGAPIKEWLGTCTDIDDMRRMQGQQRVMVAELQHRTRNLIAVIQSIARQTARGTGSTQEFQARFEDRLTALSRVQGLLSEAQTRPIGIADLVGMELAAMGAEAGERVEVSGPPVTLPNSHVQTFALALHELATNARKYGALVVEGGRLRIRWSLGGDEALPRLLFEWREENLDPVRESTSPATKGYGRELIERALPYSLGATTTYRLEGTTLLCTIDVPLRRGKRGAAA